MYVCIHAYIYAYRLMDMYTCMHAYISAYIDSCMPNTDIHTDTHVYLETCMHRYIHTYKSSIVA